MKYTLQDLLLLTEYDRVNEDPINEKYFFYKLINGGPLEIGSIDKIFIDDKLTQINEMIDEKLDKTIIDLYLHSLKGVILCELNTSEKSTI